MEVVILIFLGALGSIAAAEIWAWIPTACHSLVEFSVRQLPEHLRERMLEEWLAMGQTFETVGGAGRRNCF